jgi:hypothetical protein
VEDKHVVHDLALETERARKLPRAVQRPPVPGQRDVQSKVAIGNRARNGMMNYVPDNKVRLDELNDSQHSALGTRQT